MIAKSRILRLSIATSAAICLAVGLSACSQQIAGFVTGKQSYHPNYWVIDADTSGSTASQTYRGGPYEQEMMAALEQSARETARVYAAPVDGDTLADGTWAINGVLLRTEAGGGSSQFAEAARVQMAKRLRPNVRAILRSRLTNGSDILGALRRVALLNKELPAGASKTLILLTDGAINLSRYGGYDAYSQPPDTTVKRHQIVAQLQRSGELPQLPGWNVYLGGIGVGIGNRTTASGVIALWEELVPAMGAHLIEINSLLSFHA
jgi:hypothetical protein